MTTTLTVKGTDAINLSNIALGGKAPSVTLKAGKYAVTITSDIKYNSGSQVYCQQVILFNTAPLETGNYEKWFYVPNTSEGCVITVKDGKPVYAFIVDQVTSTDNSGSATVTFTAL